MQPWTASLQSKEVKSKVFQSTLQSPTFIDLNNRQAGSYRTEFYRSSTALTQPSNNRLQSNAVIGVGMLIGNFTLSSDDKRATQPSGYTPGIGHYVEPSAARLIETSTSKTVEARSMPSDQRIGLDDDKRVAPIEQPGELGHYETGRVGSPPPPLLSFDI